jgi:5-methyltetrahydropteroyltriglutamate--homocysteine methyltransferase
LKDRTPLLTDIANLKAARDAVGAEEAFMPAASVGIIAQRIPNRYYPSYEAYIEAIAVAMRDEYRAIVDSGLVLQIDAPEMCIDRNVPEFADRSIEDFRDRLHLWVAGLNYALDGIAEECVRLHICWGNEEAPHTRDVALPEILDIVLNVNAGAYSIEAANPRHAHDWHIWEDTKLPEGKLLIPGFIDTTTNFVEHPQLVADRILTYAKLVGRENIIAGTDCGFATTASFSAVYPPIVWAKLASLAEGARLASERLWA